MAEVRIKGVSFIHMNDFLRQEFEEAGHAKVVAALKPDVAKTLASAFGHEWYPFAHMVDVERAVAQAHFGGDATQIERFGFYDGTRQVGTIYRFLLRLLEPAFLLKQGNKIWRSYMNCGDLATESTGPRSCLVRLSGYDPLDRTHCFENVGAFKASLMVCGSKTPKVEHVECRLEGKPACVYHASW
ncbi:MAG: hypothetical protein QM765_19215 [Myxococcales bacterium]